MKEKRYEWILSLKNQQSDAVCGNICSVNFHLRKKEANAYLL